MKSNSHFLIIYKKCRSESLLYIWSVIALIYISLCTSHINQPLVKCRTVKYYIVKTDSLDYSIENIDMSFGAIVAIDKEKRNNSKHTKVENTGKHWNPVHY